MLQEKGNGSAHILEKPEGIQRRHTVIVNPPAAAVAGIDVVAVPVDRADDMVRSALSGGAEGMEVQQDLCEARKGMSEMLNGHSRDVDHVPLLTETRVIARPGKTAFVMRLVYLLLDLSFRTPRDPQDTHNALQDALPRALPPRHPGNNQFLPFIETLEGKAVCSGNQHVKRRITAHTSCIPWPSRRASLRRHPQLLVFPPLVMPDCVDGLPMDRSSRLSLLPRTWILNLQ